MDIVNLKLILQTGNDVDNFISSLANEINNYKSQTTDSQVSHVPIEGYSEDLEFEAKEIDYLFELYLNEDILEWELDFILNAIELTNASISNEIDEVISYLSTPELGLSISKDRVNACRLYLKDHKKKLPPAENKREFDGSITYRSKSD